VEGSHNVDRYWCEGRHLRWTPCLGADLSPFRLGGRGAQPAPSSTQAGEHHVLPRCPASETAEEGADEGPLSRITAVVFRDGSEWDAEASLPEPDCFADCSMIIGGDEDGLLVNEEYLICAIALLDMSVDKGVKHS